MTRADRLMTVVTAYAPVAARHYADSGGQWPLRDGTTLPSAPYAIETLPDGWQRIRLVNRDGDSLSATGATLDDALAQLEAKLGVVSHV